MNKPLLLFLFCFILLVSLEANDSLTHSFTFLQDDTVWIKRADKFELRFKKLSLENDDLYIDSVLFNKKTAISFLEEAGLDSFVLELDTVRQVLDLDSLGGLFAYNSKVSLDAFKDKLFKGSDFKWKYIIEDKNSIEGVSLYTLYVEMKNKIFEQMNLGSLYYPLKLSWYQDNLYLFNFQ